MIELIFVTCLATAPGDCQERSLLFTDVSATRCVMGAQVELARWAETHPDWRVGKWSCREVRRDSHDI